MSSSLPAIFSMAVSVSVALDKIAPRKPSTANSPTIPKVARYSRFTRVAGSDRHSAREPVDDPVGDERHEANANRVLDGSDHCVSVSRADPRATGWTRARLSCPGTGLGSLKAVRIRLTEMMFARPAVGAFLARCPSQDAVRRQHQPPVPRTDVVVPPGFGALVGQRRAAVRAVERDTEAVHR